MTEEEIFHQALARALPEERSAYLEHACAGDPALRASVEALLRANVGASGFLNAPAPALAATVDEPITERPGTVIGPYKLLESIGEGGFGVVFLAEQTQPVRRKVALKILKPGMDTRQVVARFEAERQALALMDHPNIAQVYDGGATATGRPFFIMELVKGVPITEFCDQHQLTPRERLELFLPVCQAVQHAHQKGIIHRDLKPSNVMVTVHDTTPVVKVIDFGVAKALGQELTDKTLFTGFTQMIGTTLYMSPEQAGQSGLDIDTRTDVYALGVLLYELLTGTTPFENERLRTAGFEEMRRIIREEEPPKPSTRISTLGQAATTVSTNRRSDPRRLSQLFRGELDWIVMKALEKDRNRRYDTASAFAADVQRYLHDEPVQACPPSAWYRFRKFARRNRGVLVAASAIILAVLLGVIGLAVNSWLVTREKEAKEAALGRAVEEKERADQNLKRARTAVKEYLVKISDNPHLNSADFHSLRKQLLETALPFYLEFVRQRQEDPDLEAERGAAYGDLASLRRDTGDLEQALADLEEAEKIFRRLAKTFPDKLAYQGGLAETLISRGDTLASMGRSDQAEDAYRQAVKMLDRLASEQPNVSTHREFLARAAGELGLLLKDLGRQDEADTMFRRAITLREKLIQEQPKALALRQGLAQTWINRGALFHARHQADDAAKAFQKALELLNADAAAERSGEPALSTRIQQTRAQALNNLGILYHQQHRPVDAEQAYRDALAVKQKLADTFPSVPRYRRDLARSFSNLGVVLWDLGRPEEAQEAYQKAIGLYERLAADFPAAPAYAIDLAGTYMNLGRLMGDKGQLEQALPWLTKSIEILDAAFRKDSRLAKARESLFGASWTRAVTLAGLRRFAQAVEDWDRAIALDDGRFANELRLKRASTFLNLKDHVRATADAQAIAESPKATADDLYKAACVYAICVRVAHEDGPLAEPYAEHAVRLLREALAKGYKNPTRLKTDSDLDSLRSRADFQDLVRTLPEKATME
jgi:serine/threonine protein kinase/tetratricopeptide (TPR) repeat protein